MKFIVTPQDLMAASGMTLEQLEGMYSKHKHPSFLSINVTDILRISKVSPNGVALLSWVLDMAFRDGERYAGDYDTGYHEGRRAARLEITEALRDLLNP